MKKTFNEGFIQLILCIHIAQPQNCKSVSVQGMRGGFWKGITELSYVIILLERTLLKCKVENWKLIAVKRDSWIANRCPSLNAVLSTDVKCVQLEKKDKFQNSNSNKF